MKNTELLKFTPGEWYILNLALATGICSEHLTKPDSLTDEQWTALNKAQVKLRQLAPEVR
jgi:hypothetical protein